MKIPSHFPGDNGQNIQAQNNQVQPQPPDGQATQHPGIQGSRAKIPILGDDSYIDNHRNISQPMHHDWHREFGIDERHRTGNREVDHAMAEWAQPPRRVTSFSSSSEAVGPTPSLHRVLSQRAAINLSPGLTAGLYPGVVVASNMSYTSADPPSRISSPLPRMSTPSSPGPNLYGLSTSFTEPSRQQQQQRSYTGRESPAAANFYATNQQSAANQYYRGYAEPETN